MADHQVDGYIRFEDDTIINASDAFSARSISKLNNLFLIISFHNTPCPL